MLHILLMILKIIGIILLAIIGLVLLIVALILFVPIRYRIQAHRYDDIMAKVNISWLLFVIRFALEYNGDELDTKIKILGFDGSKFIKGDTKQEKEDTLEYSNEQENAVSKANNTDILDEKKSNDMSNISDTCDSNITDNTSDADNGNVIDNISGTNNSNVNDTNNSNFTDNVGDANKDTSTDKERSVNQNDTSVSKEKKKTKKPKNIFGRLVFKLKNIYHKFKAWCKKLVNMLKKADDIKTKVSALIEFIDSREFRDNLAFVKSQLGRFFKHIMPSKHSIKLEFGTGSPDTTGEILGALAVVMALTGMNIQVIPDFDNAVFRGYIYMKGRIRLFNILIIALKVYFNKELRVVADKLINRRF